MITTGSRKVKLGDRWCNEKSPSFRVNQTYFQIDHFLATYPLWALVSSSVYTKTQHLLSGVWYKLNERTYMKCLVCNRQWKGVRERVRKGEMVNWLVGWFSPTFLTAFECPFENVHLTWKQVLQRRIFQWYFWLTTSIDETDKYIT